MRRLKCLLLLLATLRGGLGAEPEKSVIQITTFSQPPAWEAPWRFENVSRGSGSGFVVRGKRIMTNAHVVSWARQVLVRRYQDPRPYVARLAFVAHDCDLALLEVEQEEFFNGLEPLEFGELPKVRSTVVTYGYPAGGEQISYTRGVVSRIEVQTYVQIGNRGFLAVQTDAAINPGNSGGPVIQEDKVVGVAFQGIPGLENTGFFISPPVVQHFLKDIEDGTYDGFPQAGIRMAPMQNPAYRKYLRLPADDLGARIDQIHPGTASEKLLKVEDVLLQVGPYPVASDATIVHQGNRVHAGFAFSQPQHGESVPLRLWRAGQEVQVSLPVQVIRDDRNQGNQYTPPRYFVYGGLVFTPACRDFLRTLSSGAGDGISSEIFYELFHRRQEKPATWRPEPILLVATLSHPVNADVTMRGPALVDKINGTRIERLEDAIRALETSTAAFDVLEFTTHTTIECLDRAEVRKANQEILQTFGIARDRRL